ncbi:GNAT family N-acetyltransferase [Calothrix sp. 336/3]|uniref:GNAT family N-acetyltransferase n=1 Tax=Calothrix sp. 336/3 TaxID=1337936 RepID=UPI000ABA4B1A|nr:GNAT family N-acetyltransferase [Calothrix sp. 336/3]
MTVELRTRKATYADIPFLARIVYEASLPPLNHCFWGDLLPEGTSSLAFIEAMLRADASNWGNAQDFLILEAEGKPVAAAAGYTPNLEDYCPLRLSCMEAIAHHLNWSSEVAAAFSDRYLQYWGGNCQPIFLAPQAPWIIETVAVVPEARGQGLGKTVVRALLEAGKAQQYSHAGIMIINGNNTALRTYESVGFQPYQTFYSAYFWDNYQIDFPGVTKFTLRLN